MVIHPLTYKPGIMLDTTQRCNYRCSMCFWSVPKKATELLESDPLMPLELFDNALNESISYGSSICLAGAGEFLLDPLLDKRLPILQKSLTSNPNVRFFQTTNASLLTKNNLQFLKGVKKVGFTISIDSVDALTYSKIRYPGTLSNVLKNILSLRKELRLIGVNDVHIQLNMVVMKGNIFSIPGVLHLAKEIHATVFIEHPQGFGPDNLNQESLFNYPTFSNIYIEKCKKLAEQLNVGFRTPPPFAITQNEIDEYYNLSTEKKFYCEQLNSSGPMRISVKGDVSVCCKGIVFGNLKTESFKDIFFSPLYTKYRDAIANGIPLAPCDTCRFLYRKASYLYESGVYHLSIPPESRNYEAELDFEKEGFFDWVDEIPEKRLRIQLKKDYVYKAEVLFSSGISDEVFLLKSKNEINWKLVSWAKENKRIIVYPAGGQAQGWLKYSPISLLNIIGFSDKNDALHGKTFHGYSVISPAEIEKENPDIFLILSDLYQDEIRTDFKYLLESGIEIHSL